MGHRIFTGCFSELETRLLDLIAEQQAQRPLAPVSVLTGSNVLAVYLRRRIGERGRAAANIRFYTFPALVRRLGESSQPTAPKPRLSRLGAHVLLGSLLQEPVSSAFAEVAALRGFRRALADTFRDLRDAGVTPEVLLGALASLELERPERGPHLRSLAAVYRDYRERLSGLEDTDDDFSAALSGAAAAAENLASPALLVYGLYDVTGQQRSLLDALPRSMEMCYFIPFADNEASSFAGGFLSSRVHGLGVAAEKLATRPPGSSLEALAERLFRSAECIASLGDPAGAGRASAGPLLADGSFALVSVPGDSRMAVEAVREILRAVRDGTISGFHEAAVISRRPEEEFPLLAEVLRLSRIPYYIHGGSDFSLRPLARAVAAIVSIASGDASRESVLQALDFIAAASPAKFGGSWDVPQWRALTNDPRFLAGIDAWEQGTKALVAELEFALRRSENAAPGDVEAEESYWVLGVEAARQRLVSARFLRQAWSSLREAAGEWPEALTWRQWAVHLERCLAPVLGESADWDEFSETVDSIACLQDLESNTAPQRVSRAALADAFAEAVASLRSPEGRFQQRGVHLMSTAAARGIRFPLVLVPGLEEGKFPSRLRQDPLLLDCERRMIGSPPRLPLKARRFDEEKLLFDMSVRAAERRLVLFSSRLDEGADRERAPSDFFLRAAAAARGSPVGLRDLTEESIPGFRSVSLENPAPPRQLPAIHAGEVRLRLLTEHRAAARAILETLAVDEPERIRRPLEYDRARWLRNLTEYDGVFRRGSLIRWLRDRIGTAAGPLSASRLEDYARCPYFFYLKRVVQLEKWEETEPGTALDPLERGSAIHSVLERFLSGIGAGEPASASMEDLWDSLRSLAEEELSRRRPAGMPDLLWEVEHDQLLELLRHWLLFEREGAAEGLVPSFFELPFGDLACDPSVPAFIVSGGGFEFQFRGRIDRVDLSRDGSRARVIDYKVGRMPDNLAAKKRSPLMRGEKLQLAVYRGALLGLPAGSHLRHVEGEYLYLQPRDGKVVSCRFGDEEMAAAAARLPRLLEILAALLDQGVFFHRTSGTVYGEANCRFCPFTAICGKDRRWREERKSSDPSVQRFLTLASVDSAGDDVE